MTDQALGAALPALPRWGDSIRQFAFGTRSRLEAPGGQFGDISNQIEARSI
jgi:hypothetical protein